MSPAIVTRILGRALDSPDIRRHVRKRRRRAISWDGEASDAEEKYREGAGSSSINYRVDSVSERETDSRPWPLDLSGLRGCLKF